MNPFYTDSSFGLKSKIKFNLIDLNPVAIGTLEVPILQSDCAIAIGKYAGLYNQDECAIAMGIEAGQTHQGMMAVAIGTGAGSNAQSDLAIALGVDAGSDNQSTSSIAIGREAGQTQQGGYSIAIGAFAGQSNQHANSIVLNATGAPLDTLEEKACYIAPLRDAPGDTLVQYNSSSKELTTSNTLNFDLTVDGTISAINVAPPGVEWETAESPLLNRWFSVTWSAPLGLFAAISYGNEGSANKCIMTSPDGYNWTAIENTLPGQSICWSSPQAKFVAVGYNYTYTSNDGVTWTQHSSLVGSPNCIIWVDALSKYVGSSTNTIYLSNDGINFSTVNVSGIANGFTLSRIAYAPSLNRLVVVGFTNSPSGTIIYSDDGGTTWAATNPLPKTNTTWRGVAWSSSQGKFVAVAGVPGNTNQRVMTSTDGITWVLHYDAGGDCNWHEVMYADDLGLWIAVGPGSLGHVMYSANGSVWTLGQGNRPGAQNAAVYAPELQRFVAVGDGYGYPWIMTSPRRYAFAPYNA